MSAHLNHSVKLRQHSLPPIFESLYTQQYLVKLKLFRSLQHSCMVRAIFFFLFAQLSLIFWASSLLTHSKVFHQFVCSRFTLTLWPYFLPDPAEEFIRLWGAHWWVSDGVHHSFATRRFIHGPVQASALDVYIHLHQRRPHHCQSRDIRRSLHAGRCFLGVAGFV